MQIASLSFLKSVSCFCDTAVQQSVVMYNSINNEGVRVGGREEGRMGGRFGQREIEEPGELRRFNIRVSD